MVDKARNWPPNGLARALNAKRRTVIQLWVLLDQKKLARRHDNSVELERVAMAAPSETDASAKLRTPPREDTERATQYQAQIWMIDALLRALASPQLFRHALDTTRRRPDVMLYRADVKHFRRGLDVEYDVWRAWLPKSLRHASNELADVGRNRVGQRQRDLRLDPFEVELFTVEPPPEPEFTSDALQRAQATASARRFTELARARCRLQMQWAWNAYQQSRELSMMDEIKFVARAFAFLAIYQESIATLGLDALLSVIAEVRQKPPEGTSFLLPLGTTYHPMITPEHQIQWLAACDLAAEMVRALAEHDWLKQPKARVPRKYKRRRRRPTRAAAKPKNVARMRNTV